MNEYVVRVQMYNGLDDGTPVPAIKVKSSLKRLYYRNYLQDLVNKDKPKKIIIKKTSNNTWCYCPHCEHLIGAGYLMMREGTNYCVHCGQALDWGSWLNE